MGVLTRVGREAFRVRLDKENMVRMGTHRSASSVALRELETGRVVVPRLQIALGVWERTLGLLGRSELEADSALWIEPCDGVHTLGMRFPIDVLFLDPSGCALRIVTDLRPWRVAGPVRRSRVVVELPCGAVAISGIRRGFHYLKE